MGWGSEGEPRRSGTHQDSRPKTEGAPDLGPLVPFHTSIPHLCCQQRPLRLLHCGVESKAPAAVTEGKGSEKQGSTAPSTERKGSEQKELT